MDREKNVVKHLCIMLFSVIFLNDILYQLKHWYITRNIPEILPILANFSFIIIIPIVFLYGYFSTPFKLQEVVLTRLFASFMLILAIMFFFPNKNNLFLSLYFIGEYWASLIYTVWSWNMINAIFNINQAKKYHYFGYIAYIAGALLSAIYLGLLSKHIKLSNIEASGYYLVFPVIGASCLAYYSSRQIMYYNHALKQNHLKLKETKASLGCIATSKYLQIILIFSLLLLSILIIINMEYITQPIIKEFYKSINIYTNTTIPFPSEEYDILLFTNFIIFPLCLLVDITMNKILLNKFGWSKVDMGLPFGIFIAGSNFYAYYTQNIFPNGISYYLLSFFSFS